MAETESPSTTLIRSWSAGLMPTTLSAYSATFRDTVLQRTPPLLQKYFHINQGRLSVQTVTMEECNERHEIPSDKDLPACLVGPFPASCDLLAVLLVLANPHNLALDGNDTKMTYRCIEKCAVSGDFVVVCCFFKLRRLAVPSSRPEWPRRMDSDA